MSYDNDIVIIDSDDELRLTGRSKGPQTDGEFVDLCSDSDSDVILEKEENKAEVQYVGVYNTLHRSRRKDKKKKRSNHSNNNSFNDRTDEHLISSDSNQSQPKADVMTNSLKNELITPPKNQLFKTSPQFKSTNQCSAQPSKEALPQTSDDICSQTSTQTLSQIGSENSINSSVIPPSPECSPESLDGRISVTQNVSSVEEPSDVINDFGVEDMECDISIAESVLLCSPTLLERTSTPILSSNSVQTKVQNQKNETINGKTVENVINSRNETLKSSENVDKQTNESISQSVNGFESNDKSKKDIGIGTENLIRRLTFELTEAQPVGEYYVCSYNGCKEEFNNALLHYKHEKKHSNELIKKKIRTFKCHYYGCAFLGLTQIELMYHNSEHRGLFLCQKSECLFRGRTAEDVTQHMKYHRNGKKRSLRKKGIYCECGEYCCLNP